MTECLTHKHYYILHYSYNKQGKIKKASIKVPSIDIMDNKFVIIKNRHNHDIKINRDKVIAIEEVTENYSFAVIAIILLILMIVFIFYKYL